MIRKSINLFAPIVVYSFYQIETRFDFIEIVKKTFDIKFFNKLIQKLLL